MRIVTLLVGFGLVLYAGACLALLVFQRSLIYFPVERRHGDAASVMRLPVEGASLAISARPRPGRTALVYFGGNAEDVSANLAAFSAALPELAIYLMHYRGYGGSTGKPSEQALHADARALFDKVHAEHPDITVMGRSLGSGVALRLAAERPAARLILVTPYDSLQEIAAARFPYFPVRFLLTDKFESWRYAPAIRVPTLLLQAGRDELIPAASTQALYARFAPGVASLATMPGEGHNFMPDTPRYLNLLREAMAPRQAPNFPVE